jgi:hypothetical protein
LIGVRHVLKTRQLFNQSILNFPARLPRSRLRNPDEIEIPMSLADMGSSSAGKRYRPHADLVLLVGGGTALHWAYHHGWTETFCTAP